MKPVIIVGAGWAGLAAGCSLASAGIPVCVLEAAPRAGGRASSFVLHDRPVDNGQHLLIGAYRQTLQLLQSIGACPEALFHREPLQLQVMREPAPLQLKATRLPAPLHLLGAVWNGLHGVERRKAIYFALQAWRKRFHLAEDCSVARLLAEQPESLILALWQPLCLATLNTPLDEASANVFLRILRDAFNDRCSDSDLLHPHTTLENILPVPARRHIERYGGQVLLRERVLAMEFADAEAAVITAQGRLTASHIILATAPWHTARLLRTHPTLQDLGRQLESLGSSPINTIYLAYPHHVSLGRSMLGFAGGYIQWLIDRGVVASQPGLLAAVISTRGPHQQLSGQMLADEVARELAGYFPHWPAPLWTRCIREQRSTFLCSPGSNARRPGHRTLQQGLWLAGDYTDTGYPATLEGAVRSGLQCAETLIQEYHHA